MTPYNRLRSKNCAVLGAPSELKKNVLPTIKDVLCCIHHTENQMVHPPRGCVLVLVLGSVALEVKDIWQNASIPSVSARRIIVLMKKHYNTCRLLLKKTQSKAPETPKFKWKKEAFVNLCDNLFDIATCKCKDFSNCSCIKENKVSIQI